MKNPLPIKYCIALKDLFEDCEHWRFYSKDCETYPDDRSGYYVTNGQNIFSDSKICPCPTLEELLEKLPQDGVIEIKGKIYQLIIYRHTGEWVVGLLNVDGSCVWDDLEIEYSDPNPKLACAKLLCKINGIEVEDEK